MLRVYTASKLKHAAMWRDLCASTPHLQAHARWLKHSTLGTPDTPEHAVEFWLQDEQDVKDADAVLVFATGDDHLRGALVEAGMAIAYGVPVIVIGKHADYGTWQHHPGVTRMDDLASALLYLKSLKPRYRRVA
jgi:nucleoside 2-deoxyribosyltransferase